MGLIIHKAGGLLADMAGNHLYISDNKIIIQLRHEIRTIYEGGETMEVLNMVGVCLREFGYANIDHIVRDL